MDVRPGGRWRACLRSIETGNDLWVGGVYREIVPPERLVFTFAWEEEGERGLETVVDITLTERDGKTHMTMRQTPFQSTASSTAIAAAGPAASTGSTTCWRPRPPCVPSGGTRTPPTPGISGRQQCSPVAAALLLFSRIVS